LEPAQLPERWKREEPFEITRLLQTILDTALINVSQVPRPALVEFRRDAIQ